MGERRTFDKAPKGSFNARLRTAGERGGRECAILCAVCTGELHCALYSTDGDYALASAVPNSYYCTLATQRIYCSLYSAQTRRQRRVDGRARSSYIYTAYSSHIPLI